MISRPRVYRGTRSIVAAVLVACLQSCGSDESASPPGTDFTLSLSPSILSVAQGATATVQVTVARTNYSGPVTLSVSNLPSGISVSFGTNPVSGTNATMTITVSAGVAATLYTLIVRANASGFAERTAPAALTVTLVTGSTGNVTLDYSACAAGAKPIWLAFQNGTGSWSQVAGTADVYRFTLSSAKGSIAWVTQSAPTQTQLAVQSMTQAEMTAAPIAFCAVPGTKTVNGTVLGIGSGQVANISLGGSSRAVGSGVPTFSLTTVPAGNQDLVAYRFAAGAQSSGDRIIIRRDQNVASGGSLAAVDFGAAEAIAPSFVIASISGAVGEQLTHFMQYLTGSACVAAPLYSIPVPGSTATMYGVPSAQQRPNDYHMLTVIATTANTTRVVQETFHTLAGRLLALGSVLPNVSLSAPVGAYKRVQATVTLPSEYQSTASLTYTQSQGATVRAAVISATFGWRGGDAAVLGVPDFAGVAGWNDQWAPLNGITGNWTVQATGSNFTGTLCAESTRLISTTAQGTF